jgi:tetratricopeptide (TPR) repeat protein
MPSHTFTRIGDWQASIDTNTASAAAAEAAHQPADVLHASDYMVYAYLQSAQDAAAERWVRSSAGAFATLDPAHVTGAAPASAAYFAHATIPARYCLERQAWADATKLEVLPSPYPYADAMTYFARGLGAAHTKDAPALEEAIQSLQQTRDKLAQSNDGYWANQTEIQQQELSALLALLQGRSSDALTGMRRAAIMEDRTETASVTPGPLKPARELLGEMLLQEGRPSQALAEFKGSLRREPNRFWSIYGVAVAAQRVGNHKQAQLYFSKLLLLANHADQGGRPELLEARAAVQRASIPR